jgi:hypothetical protein
MDTFPFCEQGRKHHRQPVIGFPDWNMLLCLFLLFLPFGVNGQKAEQEFVRCATMMHDSIRRAQNPRIPSLFEFEENLAHSIASRKRKKTLTETLMTIPVVVHVVHNGEPIGNDPNISQAQIQSQIDVLNEDFRRTGAGFNTHPDGADINIEFALAKVDPDGNVLSQPGIDRVDGGQNSWNYDDLETTLKPATIWDPTRYLNIWTANLGGDLDGILGYAQFPDMSGLGGLSADEGASNTDGVVLGYLFCGVGHPEAS